MKKNRKRKIFNLNIVMLVIVFVSVMAVLIHSYAEESNVSQEEIESSDTIHNVDYSYTSDNKNIIRRSNIRMKCLLQIVVLYLLISPR